MKIVIVKFALAKVALAVHLAKAAIVMSLVINILEPLPRERLILSNNQININMEQNMAILFADLSGYTALTEIHGAVSAADVIDKYVDMVKDSLTNNVHLHEQTGDEIMLISRSADDMLKTAVRLIENSSGEDHFLQLHGGLHFGKVLQRRNHYFGTAINLTSRIAARANAGSFWCSSNFLDAIAANSSVSFEPKGPQVFKNLTEETEVFEFNVHSSTVHIDPVCKMQVLAHKHDRPHLKKGDHFFCSTDCLDLFAGAMG